MHGENLYLKNAEKEIVEMKKWFQSNSNFLNKFQEKEFMIRLQSKEFVNIKLNKNFFYTLKFFLKSTYLMKNLRNYLLLIAPSFILKKIMWYQ